MNVTLVPKSLQLKHTWTLARGSTDAKHYHYFRIDHQGIVAWGEAAHNARYDETPESVCSALEKARSILEESPSKIESWQEWVPSLSSDQAAAKAAVDIACRDWLTQARNEPFFPKSTQQSFVTSFSIGIDEPENLHAKVEEAADFEVLKIKLGTSQDREIIDAVRAVTDKPLRIDANEGWTDKEEALRMIEWLAAHNITLIEQPMPAGRLDDVAWLRERSPLPLVADEDVCGLADIDQLAGVYDGINVKLMKAGGATSAAAMLERARQLGLQTMLGCMIESSIGITAASFLAEQVDWIDLDGNLLIQDDPFSGTVCQNGRLTVPEGPGLGVRKR